MLFVRLCEILPGFRLGLLEIVPGIVVCGLSTWEELALREKDAGDDAWLPLAEVVESTPSSTDVLCLVSLLGVL